VIRFHNSYHWKEYLENIINDIGINYVTMNLRIKICTNCLSLFGFNSFIFHTGDIYHTHAQCSRHNLSRSAHTYAHACVHVFYGHSPHVKHLQRILFSHINITFVEVFHKELLLLLLLLLSFFNILLLYFFNNILKLK